MVRVATRGEWLSNRTQRSTVTNTPTPPTIEMNVLILERLPGRRHVQAIRLDVSVRNQWYGEINFNCNTDIPPFGEEFSAVVKMNKSSSLEDNKSQS